MLRQLSVFLENRPGTLSHITGLLAENGIDLRALFIAESTDYGMLRMIVSDTDKAIELLKEDGVPYDITEVVAVRVPDRPGGLAELLKNLSDENIDVHYMYSVFSKDNNQALMVLKVSDVELMNKVFKEKGIISEELDNLK